MTTTINFSSAGMTESVDTSGSLGIQTANATAILCNGTSSIVSFPTTGYLNVPSGTTAQRPSSPVNGMIRYNTTLSKLEGYANNSWGIF
jgi:hypothetical protein